MRFVDIFKGLGIEKYFKVNINLEQRNSIKTTKIIKIIRYSEFLLVTKLGIICLRRIYYEF